MAARPWEARSSTEKELYSHSVSLRSAACSVEGETNKVHAIREAAVVDKPSPVARRLNTFGGSHSPPPSLSKPSPAARRRSPGIALGTPEDDRRSLASVQSERIRRHGLAGSSAKDDESIASSPAALPRYMVSTQSAKAKSRLQSPSADRLDTPGKASFGSVKKWLSFPSGDNTASSPIAARRHSGPPKMDLGRSVKNVAAGRDGG